jgi:hypothetical protein
MIYEMKRPTIVEPWHPDILSRKFLDDMFAGRMDARRYIDINPNDMRGLPVMVKPGNIVKMRRSSGSAMGVVLETYLAEVWQNRNTEKIAQARPQAYDLMCMIKWTAKRRTKAEAGIDAEMISAGMLTVVSDESKQLKVKIQELQKKLLQVESSFGALNEYYAEFIKSETAVNVCNVSL